MLVFLFFFYINRIDYFAHFFCFKFSFNDSPRETTQKDAKCIMHRLKIFFRLKKSLKTTENKHECKKEVAQLASLSIFCGNVRRKKTSIWNLKQNIGFFLFYVKFYLFLDLIVKVFFRFNLIKLQVFFIFKTVLWVNQLQIYC